MTELVTFGEAALQLSPPDQRRLETTRNFDVHVSGPECNAAVVAGRLGVETAWLSKLPDTPLGRRVVGELREHGIEVDIVWGSGRQGITYYQDGPAPRRGQRIDDRDRTPITDIDTDELLLDRIDDADGVYVTGATPALSTALAGATAGVLRSAADADTLTALGLSYRPDRWPASHARETLTELFPAVDVFVANEGDIARVLDRDGQPQSVAHALASEWDFETVAITRQRGAVAWHDATVHEYAAPESEVIDPTGAEDAFAGAFVARLLVGAPASTALQFAVAAGALARTVPGPVAAVSGAEVDRLATRISDGDA